MGTEATPLPTPALCVEARALTKRYGGVAVLDALDLQVREGEFVAIVGESGVGKSTLLNCLAGLDDWDSGEVWLAGRAWHQMHEPARAAWRREALGFVFQAFHVLPHLSVAQNVGLPLMLLGVAPAEQAQRVDAMLQATGLGGMGERLPQSLSGGQLQRVAIARALVHRPRVILADEPTGNLDPRTAQQILDLLVACTRDHRAALLLVTHSEVAAQRADRRLSLGAAT